MIGWAAFLVRKQLNKTENPPFCFHLDGAQEAFPCIVVDASCRYSTLHRMKNRDNFVFKPLPSSYPRILSDDVSVGIAYRLVIRLL